MRATRDGQPGRDDRPPDDTAPAGASYEAIAEKLHEERLKERFGVRIGAEVSAPGSLDDWTEIHTSPKPKRFRDERD